MSLKNLPSFVTFTGIDDRTDLTKAEELAQQYPIEYGFYSPFQIVMPGIRAAKLYWKWRI